MRKCSRAVVELLVALLATAVSAQTIPPGQIDYHVPKPPNGAIPSNCGSYYWHSWYGTDTYSCLRIAAFSWMPLGAGWQGHIAIANYSPNKWAHVLATTEDANGFGGRTARISAWGQPAISASQIDFDLPPGASTQIVFQPDPDQPPQDGSVNVQISAPDAEAFQSLSTQLVDEAVVNGVVTWQIPVSPIYEDSAANWYTATFLQSARDQLAAPDAANGSFAIQNLGQLSTPPISVEIRIYDETGNLITHRLVENLGANSVRAFLFKDFFNPNQNPGVADLFPPNMTGALARLRVEFQSVNGSQGVNGKPIAPLVLQSHGNSISNSNVWPVPQP